MSPCTHIESLTPQVRDSHLPASSNSYLNTLKATCVELSAPSGRIAHWVLLEFSSEPVRHTAETAARLLDKLVRVPHVMLKMTREREREKNTSEKQHHF